MIDTRFQSFIKLAALGSFTKAADALSLSQPAVTQHIKQLEEHYGVQLFFRAHGRLELTKEGKLLLRHATRMAAMERALEEALKNEKDRIHSLNVGITHTAESSAIIEALAAYTTGGDRLNLRILTNTTENLQRMLNNYELDIAFLDRESSSPDLLYTPLDTDRLMLAAAPENALAARSSVTISELQQEPLILRLPESNTRTLFAASLESLNLSIRDFNVIIEIDSIATIKDLVRRNFGVSVLAKSACMDEYKKGKLALLPIEKLSMERTTGILCRRDFGHPEIIEGVIRAYRDMQR